MGKKGRGLPGYALMQLVIRFYSLQSAFGIDLIEICLEHVRYMRKRSGTKVITSRQCSQVTGTC